MAESTLMPQTAPRSIEALMQVTPFQLRLLVQKLGGLVNEQDKMAWHDLQTPDARARYVLDMLTGWDKANPGAAQVPTAPTPPSNGVVNGVGHVSAPTHAAQQPQFGVPMQQVTPMAPAGYGPPAVSPEAQAAAAAATGAAPVEADKPKRQPRTAPSAAPVAGDPGTLLAEGLKTLLDNSANNSKRIDEMFLLLQAASDAKSGRVTLLEDKHLTLAADVAALRGIVQQSHQLQVWTLMAFLTFMQESMGAPITDILGAAIGDSASFNTLVTKAQGKG